MILFLVAFALLCGAVGYLDVKISDIDERLRRVERGRPWNC